MTKIITEKKKGVNRHWKNYKDTQYLGSHNLEEGEEMILTIEKFEGEELVQKASGDKEPKMVLYFKETVPKMILNITNASTIANLYGQHPEQWFGKKIQVFATPVKAFGKTQDALRIRDFLPERNVDVMAYGQQLEAATTLEELKTIWSKFPISVRNNADMIAIKDVIKAKLA